MPKVNAYEIRKNLRKLKQQERAKIKKESNQITRHQIEARYEEAFKIHFGTRPVIKKSLSSKTLLRMTENLYAELHAKEIESEETD